MRQHHPLAAPALLLQRERNGLSLRHAPHPSHPVLLRRRQPLRQQLLQVSEDPLGHPRGFSCPAPLTGRGETITLNALPIQRRKSKLISNVHSFEDGVKPFFKRLHARIRNNAPLSQGSPAKNLCGFFAGTPRVHRRHSRRLNAAARPATSQARRIIK